MDANKTCGVCKGKGGHKARKTLLGFGIVKDAPRGSWLRCLACDGTGRERSAQEGVAALLAPSPAPADGGAE